MIAIGAAATALVVAIVAVVVVVMREPAGPAPASGSRPAGSEEPPGVISARVPANELAKLRRGTVERSGRGVRVSDPELRDVLGLEADDIITHVAGRAIEAEPDVDSAVTAASSLEAAVLYVELERAGKRVLARWQIDGNLRAARLGHVPRSSFSGPRDPLLDTIVKIDDYRYEVPRSTIERVLANPLDFARGARIVPAMQGGAPAGLKLYAVRPSSIWAALGFANGDTIRAINGHEVTSADDALLLYTKLHDAKEVAIDITRRGRYELITILIR